MEKILVAGASGRLGKAVLGELRRRGYRTRALVRESARLNGSAPLAGEVFTGDARRAATLEGVCEGVGAVVSAMGASLKLGRTGAGGGYREVDLGANLNLLECARSSGVRKFIYVSLHGAERLRGHGYVDAHEEFVEALSASGLAYTVVRPTGFFYVFEEIFKMAERGRVVLVGGGGVKTNPVHEEDVARECADAVEVGERELHVGGPETYTRREIAELAFAALRREPKVSSIPPWLARALLRPVRLFDQRLYDFCDFGVAACTTDLVAPPAGKRSFKRYFEQLASGGPGPSSDLLIPGERERRVSTAELRIPSDLRKSGERSRPKCDIRWPEA
jgi:uncharacterized protein YbjT (DUF2867 family)